jgi:hypothetical protein
VRSSDSVMTHDQQLLKRYMQATRNVSVFYEILDMARSVKEWMEDQDFDPTLRKIDSEINDRQRFENRETFLFRKAIGI